MKRKLMYFSEKTMKRIIPERFHPLFTPLKKAISKKRLTGIWFITWQCNFKCPYCWQREEPELYRKPKFITSEGWITFWNKLSNQFDEIVLEISGGEPFFLRDLLIF